MQDLEYSELAATLLEKPIFLSTSGVNSEQLTSFIPGRMFLMLFNMPAKLLANQE